MKKPKDFILNIVFCLMDRLTAALIAFAVAVICIAATIGYFFGVWFLIRLILGLIFLGLVTIFAVMFGILTYAKSFKYALLSALGLVSSAYAVYQCYTWTHPMHVLYIIVAYIAVLVFGIWWISEPDLSILERLRSATSLERSGNYRAAARKFEKKGDYIRAAECYIKAGMLESAAWCYEKAENFAKAAELYERLAKEKGEAYYWKEAYEFWKKAGNKVKAAECLENYAKDEPWYWEDVAKLYEEVGMKEKAEDAWRKALEYYTKEAQEEGVFWEDVAKIYEKLGKGERAKEAWMRYAEYCEGEAEKDPAWWKHVAEAYENLGDKQKAEEARRRYEEYKKLRTKTEIHK